ncbi:glycosyltransferase family 2 protein [Tropicimonas sp. IMCC6043]|uniref:glycosyltransferase family 2 protein n=1 Tax=Tropicimonas sp. IMCC6043 TaxID=2510645 RepID=UPI00101CF55C|nr:glycosyltransferase family 2 protein [Tropicimonas sp. IMCC6043]RYH05958.1 glycosyltransferase family 2 protein [Tropicimonas sp. IMCC6043]
MVRLSVIVPVYNVEDLIHRSLASARRQSLKDIEIICVNDGSTDETRERILKIRNEDPRVVLIDQKNTGAGGARNCGMQVAKGEFIAFLDADDQYSTKTALASLYSTATHNGVDIAGGSFERLYTDGRIQKKFNGIHGAYTFGSAGKITFREYQFDYGYQRFIFSRKLLTENSIQFPNYKRFQDPPFFVRSMIASDAFFAIPDRVYRYSKGHKAVRWNRSNVEDLILGLKDNLRMSREHGLDRLHALTYRRLVTEFVEPVLTHAPNDDGIYRCLTNFMNELDIELLRSGEAGVDLAGTLDRDFARHAFLGLASPPLPDLASPPAALSRKKGPVGRMLSDLNRFRKRWI